MEIHPPLRILFFGTADFAVPSLRALVADNRFRVEAVVTQPDRPRGRGREVQPSPVKVAALELMLPVWQPERARALEFVQRVVELQPDFLAVAAYGQILPQSLLDAAKIAPVNLHGSLLPKFRGAAPIQYALLHGETTTGVSTMWMDAGMDTGDMLLKVEAPIHVGEDAGSLTERLAELGAPLLVETLISLAEGKCPRTSQNEAEATYAPSIKRDDCWIDWRKDAKSLVNQVRGLSPRPGAASCLNNTVVKVFRAVIEQEIGEPGQVLGLSNEGILVGTGGGSLRIVECQPAGKRRMLAAEWARGGAVKIFDQFDIQRSDQTGIG